jgi:GNAT superfamily N-acetyltransferase
MTITLQPATAADVDALVDVQQKAFKRLYDIYHDEGSPYLRGADEILRWLERPNWKVFKILTDGADGVLVGGIAAREQLDNPGECYLARVYILPEMQSKGIASTAILLCEAEFPFATHWTLDFPIDQIANRRCYEKAGYVDTGETREQSEGKIVLALYEKPLPAFRNIKEHIGKIGEYSK